MAWGYHDDDLPAPDAPVRLGIVGLPKEATPAQYRELESAGQLELLESPRWVQAKAGVVALPFALPRQGLSLVQVGW